jgi:hypothetical protein
MVDPYADYRRFVEDALTQRATGDVPDYLRPSEIWQYFSGRTRYVRTLLPQDLRDIRYHTWHLTSDNYQTYYFGSTSTKRCMVEEYEFIRSMLPAGPGLAEGSDGIGFDSPHGKISSDSLRYLLVLTELYQHGCLRLGVPQRVLEIGGGYGGLASQIMRLNPQTAYVLVDLEEALFYQAVYLHNQFGAEAVALFDVANGKAPEVRPGRFHLIPQARFECVRDQEFDLAVNQQSMQEMNDQQVAHYCDLLAATTNRFFSCNMHELPSHVRKNKHVFGLNDYLAGRFPVLWRSDEHQGGLDPLLARLPLLENLWQRARNSVAIRSELASRLYRQVAGKPILRFGDRNLLRMVFAPRGKGTSPT